MTSQSSTASVPAGGGRSRRSTAAILLEFLGSMNLAITLLVAVAIASVVGTVLQQNQPYNDYLIKFGPYWHEVFQALGLYDVYGAGWFLTILGFLVVSTSVCIYRHTPIMLRDMRHFRLGVQEKSLRAFRHVDEVQSERPAQEVEAVTRKILEGQGYRVREKDHGEHRVLSAMKGGANRLGYLFTHVAIVVICLGGLMDGNLPMKIAELAGNLKPETRNLPANEVPQISQVGIDNFSFRGSVDIPEGQRANVVFLPMRDGYLVQHLPFEIEVKDFRVEHYSNGQPKSFESDLVLHDPDLDAPIEQTIAVNHPLIHRGFAIYQSSFGDGGSVLGLRLWPLNPQKNEAHALRGEIFQSYPVETSEGPLSLELDDFRLFNINPVINEQGETEQRNMGPSFTFKLRDEAGQAREFVNYMNPVEQEGRFFYLSGVRATPNEDFRYLHIPMDPGGGVERFMRFLAYVQSPNLVRQVAQETTRQAMGSARLDSEEMETQVANSMARLVLTFGEGGFDAVAAQVEENIPPEQQEQAVQAFMRVLQTGLQGVYGRVLEDVGVTEPTEADWQHFDDSVTTMGALPFYGTPYYIQLSDFRQIEATGLQITRSPGKNVVYLGSAMLTIGVFLLFYVAHRRVWLWVKPEGEGSRYILAGTTNRNMLEFDKLFAGLAQGLRSVLGDKTEAQKPDTRS